ncbi:MAG: hypothetical protein ACI4RI_04430 [Ruminococcus sp.]
MKKLLSFMLTLVMVFSAFTVMPSAGAETIGTENNTVKQSYIPSKTICSNNYGMVYMYKDKLMGRDAQGNTGILYQEYYGRIPDLTFFLRGEEVVYFNEKTREIFSIQLNGKNRKKIAEKIGDLVGGYGDDVITYASKYIYKISPDGKITELCRLPLDSYRTFMFGEWVYVVYNPQSQYGLNNCNYYCYNLAGPKDNMKVEAMTLNFAVREYNYFFGEKYLYYTDNHKRLIRMDRNDKKTVIDKNTNKYKEYTVYGANNGGSVVYSKKDKSGNKVFYRKTIGQKKAKLCTQKDIKNKVVSVLKKRYKNKVNSIEGAWVKQAVMSKNKVYFVVSYSSTMDSGGDMLFSVDKNGGKLKNCIKEHKIKIENLEYANNYISYKAYYEKWNSDYSYTYSTTKCS